MANSVSDISRVINGPIRLKIEVSTYSSWSKIRKTTSVCHSPILIAQFSVDILKQSGRRVSNVQVAWPPESFAVNNSAARQYSVSIEPQSRNSSLDVWRCIQHPCFVVSFEMESSIESNEKELSSSSDATMRVKRIFFFFFSEKRCKFYAECSDKTMF